MTPYYEENGITIYHGRAEDVLPDLELVDLTVTSPPYDDLRKYDGYSFDFKTVAQELCRVIKPGGVVVWVVGDATVDGSETGTSFRQALYFKDALGLNLHDTMIYQKYGNAFPSGNRYTQVFEYMFVFSKGSPASFNPIRVRTTGHNGRTIGSKNRGTVGPLKYRVDALRPNQTKTRDNVWLIAAHGLNATRDAVAFNHPAIFPEALANDHIRTWSRLGDTVLDPMMGSGTTGKMARKNGCKFIGIEISEKYCEIAANRLRQEVLAFA